MEMRDFNAAELLPTTPGDKVQSFPLGNGSFAAHAA